MRRVPCTCYPSLEEEKDKSTNPTFGIHLLVVCNSHHIISQQEVRQSNTERETRQAKLVLMPTKSVGTAQTAACIQ